METASKKLNKQSRHYYSAVDLPVSEVSSCGDKVYEWSYFDDKTGKLVNMKKNVYEEIQSNVSRTDYKKLLKENLDGYGFNDNDLFLDTSELPRDFASHCDYIASLADRVNQMRQEQGQQIKQASEQVKQNEEKGSEVVQSSGATPEQQSGGNA